MKASDRAMEPDLSPASADFVIVGAASAGCALAARLSEDPACEVRLYNLPPRCSVRKAALARRYCRRARTLIGLMRRFGTIANSWKAARALNTLTGYSGWRKSLAS